MFKLCGWIQLAVADRSLCNSHTSSEGWHHLHTPTSDSMASPANEQDTLDTCWVNCSSYRHNILID